MSISNESWEVFDYAGMSKSDKRPLISLQLRGSFQINRAAYELIGMPTKIQLLYNKEKHLVGFRKVKEDERASYNVRKSRTSSTYVVSAQAFVNHYDIPLTETRRYLVMTYGEVVGIDLNAPEAASSRAAKALQRK